MTLNPIHEPLRHGYTLDNLDRLTRTVLTVDHWRNDLGDDRYAAIHFAITETVLTADERPTPSDLIACGRTAGDRHVRAQMHSHGYDQRNTPAGTGALPGFQRYWQQSGHTPWDERLVESMALTQIWPRLTPGQQQAVMALALTGDHQEAALSLGLGLEAYFGRLKAARRRVAALWHEHETPPRRRRHDRRVLSRSGTWRGRPLLTEQDVDRLRGQRAAGVTLKTMAAETGYSKTTLSDLLTGKKRPSRQHQDAAA